jgi:hypothetical protein
VAHAGEISCAGRFQARPIPSRSNGKRRKQGVREAQVYENEGDPDRGNAIGSRAGETEGLPVCPPRTGDDVPDCREWEEKAANLPKAEIKRRGNTDAQVVEKLAEVGVSQDEQNLRNKLSRGKFAGALLLQCLSAIDTTQLLLEQPA